MKLSQNNAVGKFARLRTVDVKAPWKLGTVESGMISNIYLLKKFSVDITLAKTLR